MDKDFTEKVKRKKIRKTAIGVIIIAACVILALGLFLPRGGSAGSGSASVTIEIRCDDLSNNMESLNDKALVDYIPKDGVILKETEVKIEPGSTSVFDVLDKVCRDENIQIEYSTSPGYNSHYVEGINYLYEFSAGKYSGWMFTVNGKTASYGADNVMLNEGDKVVWYYSVDYRTEDSN